MCQGIDGFFVSNQGFLCMAGDEQNIHTSRSKLAQPAKKHAPGGKEAGKPSVLWHPLLLKGIPQFFLTLLY